MNRIEDVYEYFQEKLHIRLKMDWFRQCIRYLNQTAQDQSDNMEYLLVQIFLQWKFSHISLTTEPNPQTMQQFQSPSKVITQHCVLQIESLLDVGQPLFRQFKQLTATRDDNAEFNTEPLDDFDIIKYRNPAQILLLRLTDGSSEFRAIEQKPVSGQLSLLTCPGAKVVLTGPTPIRNGMLMLRAENCQLFGGAVASLFANRPLELMAGRLHRPISQQKSCNPPLLQPQSHQQQQRRPAPVQPVHAVAPAQPVLVQPRVTTNENESQPFQAPPLAKANHSANHSSFSSGSSSSGPGSGLCPNRTAIDPFMPKPLVEIVDTHQQRQFIARNSPVPVTSRQSRTPPQVILSPPSPKGLAQPSCSSPSPPPSFVFSSQYQRTPSPTTDIQVLKDEVKDEEEVFVEELESAIMAFGRSESKMQHPSQYIDATTATTTVKDLNVARKENHDTTSNVRNNEVPVDQQSNCLKKFTLNKQPPQTMEELEQKDTLVKRYRELGLHNSLSELQRKVAFAVGPRRHFVQGFFAKIINPLGFLSKNEWTFSGLLVDDTDGRLECSFAAALLNEHIGMTPSEALSVKRSGSMAKRDEGNRKIDEFLEQLSRLDLVFEIELRHRSPGIVHGLQTLSQALGII